MKKLVAISLAGSLFATNALASSWFLGFESERNFKSTTEFKYANNALNTKIDDKTYDLVGIKFGYDFDFARIYYGHYAICKSIDAKIEVDGDARYKFKHKKQVLGIDFTPSINDKIKLVFGGYGGLKEMKFKADTKIKGKDTNENTTLRGAVFGGKIGTIINLGVFYSDPEARRVEIELGAKADYSNFNKYDAKHSSVGVYTAINYKF